MRRARPILAGAMALGVTIAIAGCTSSPVGATATRAPGHPAVATPSPTVTTPPPTPHVSGATPIHLDCATLVKTSTIRVLAPGYARIKGYTANRDSPVTRLATLGGTVCGWQDASTGHWVQVAVAHPSAADQLALKNDLVERSNSVPTYGEEAYFQIVGGVGEADDFHGPYWIVARSQDLYEPGDAAGIVTAVHKALDARG
jgi:hypothetical protein